MKKLLLLPLVLWLIVFPLNHRTFAKEPTTRIIVDLWVNKLLVLKERAIIYEFPIAPGKQDSPTPIGHFTVVEKSKEWGGGFGSRWLGLDVPWGTYGIHGTNKPWLIGGSFSSGCIRMMNKDVEFLYEHIEVGTPVEIIGPIMGTGKYEFKNISKGSKGNLVQIVQNRLKAAGYYYGICDGIYDNKTEQAIKKYQKDYELPITGGVTFREYLHLGLIE
jgi:hypothetical protein